MGGDPNPYFLSNFSTCVSTFSREKGGGQSLNIFLLRLGHFPKKSRVTKIQTFEENYSVCHRVLKNTSCRQKIQGGRERSRLFVQNPNRYRFSSMMPSLIDLLLPGLFYKYKLTN